MRRDVRSAQESAAARCLSPFPADQRATVWPVAKKGTGTERLFSFSAGFSSIPLGASPLFCDSRFQFESVSQRRLCDAVYRRLLPSTFLVRYSIFGTLLSSRPLLGVLLMPPALPVVFDFHLRPMTLVRIRTGHHCSPIIARATGVASLRAAMADSIPGPRLLRRTRPPDPSTPIVRRRGQRDGEAR